MDICQHFQSSILKVYLKINGALYTLRPLHQSHWLGTDINIIGERKYVSFLSWYSVLLIGIMYFLKLPNIG